MQFKLKSGNTITLKDKMPMKVFRSMDLKALDINAIKKLNSQKGDTLDLGKVMPMIDWMADMFKKLGWDIDEVDTKGDEIYGVDDLFQFIQDDKFNNWFEGLFGVLKT